MLFNICWGSLQGTLGLSVVDNYEANIDTRVRTWCTTLPRVGKQGAQPTQEGFVVTVAGMFQLRRIYEKFEVRVKVDLSSGLLVARGHIVFYDSAVGYIRVLYLRYSSLNIYVCTFREHVFRPSRCNVCSL